MTTTLDGSAPPQTPTNPVEQWLNRPRNWAKLAVVLAIAIVVSSILNAVFGKDSHRSTSTTVYDDVASVVIDSPDDVLIVADSVSGVRVQRQVQWSGSGALDESFSGGNLVLEGCENPDGCEVDYVVHLPIDSSIPVSVTSGSGDVNVSGAGAAVIDVGSGDVKASDIGGPLSVTASSGDVDASNVSGTVKITAGSGSVAAKDLSGTVATATSDSGSIDLEFDVTPAAVTAKSGSNDVSVAVPAASYKVAAKSGSGDVAVGVSNDSGSTNTITAYSDSGDVAVTSTGD